MKLFQLFLFSFHLLHSEYKLLPSGRCYRVPFEYNKRQLNMYNTSFIPPPANLLNSRHRPSVKWDFLLLRSALVSYYFLHASRVVCTGMWPWEVWKVSRAPFASVQLVLTDTKHTHIECCACVWENVKRKQLWLVLDSIYCESNTVW